MVLILFFVLVSFFVCVVKNSHQVICRWIRLLIQKESTSCQQSIQKLAFSPLAEGSEQSRLTLDGVFTWKILVMFMTKIEKKSNKSTRKKERKKKKKRGCFDTTKGKRLQILFKLSQKSVMRQETTNSFTSAQNQQFNAVQMKHWKTEIKRKVTTRLQPQCSGKVSLHFNCFSPSAASFSLQWWHHPGHRGHRGHRGPTSLPTTAGPPAGYSSYWKRTKLRLSPLPEGMH